MSQQVGSLVVGRETRKERRARQKAEKRLRAEFAREAKQKAKRAAENEAVEALPSFGESRRWAERQVWPGRAVKFSDTTRALRTVYPFLAEPGLGSRGMLMGHNMLTWSAFCYDPWELYQQGVLTNPNISIAGVVGTGKSALCKSLVTRGRAFGRRAYVPGDVKGEWSAVARQLGGSVIQLGPGTNNRINPLDEGTRPRVDAFGELLSDEMWREMVRRTRLDLVATLCQSVLDRRLSPEEQTAMGVALDRACERFSTPLLGTVAEELLDPSGQVFPTGVSGRDQLSEYGRTAGHGLMRLVRGDLAGMFDGPSTEPFDTTAPMVTVDLFNVAQHSAALPLIMSCTAAWMETSLRDPDAGKRWVIYDEAHRLMEQDVLLNRMKEQWKVARSWGLANVLVLHRYSDLDAVGDKDSRQRALAEGLLADTETRIIFRQEADQMDRTKHTLGLSHSSVDVISHLQRGQALWQIKGHPYLIQTRYTAEELALFDTDTRMKDAA